MTDGRVESALVFDLELDRAVERQALLNDGVSDALYRPARNPPTDRSYLATCTCTLKPNTHQNFDFFLPRPPLPHMSSPTVTILSRSISQGIFNKYRQGALPLANTLLTAIRNVIRNSESAAKPLTAHTATATVRPGRWAQEAAAVADLSSSDSSSSAAAAAAALVARVGPRADVPLVDAWVRAREPRFDLAVAHAQSAACSSAARNHVLHALALAGHFDRAVPLVLDERFAGSWLRPTLNALLARVGAVQINELSMLDLLFVAGASGRKRRVQLFQSLVLAFRASRCAVNAATTNAVLAAWLAVRAEAESGESVREQWQQVVALLASMDTTRTLAAVPVNGGTFALLAAHSLTPDDVELLFELIGSHRQPLSASLCIDVARACVRNGDAARAIAFVHQSGLLLTDDAWAQVIALFDRAGFRREAAQLLFQQELWWSLPSEPACTRMLVALALLPRDEIARRRSRLHLPDASARDALDEFESATPTAVHSLFQRAGHPYRPRYLSALVRAHVSFGMLLTVGEQLALAQTLGVRLSQRIYVGAIEANFLAANLCSALIVWRMLVLAHPELADEGLRDSVHAFLRASSAMPTLTKQVVQYFSDELADELPVVDWRFRADDPALAKFVSAAAVVARRHEHVMRNWALGHVVTQAPPPSDSSSVATDLAAAYKRSQKLHLLNKQR